MKSHKIRYNHRTHF